MFQFNSIASLSVYSHLVCQQYVTAFSIDSNSSLQRQEEIWFLLQRLLQDVAELITQMFSHQIRAVAATALLFAPSAIAQHWEAAASPSGEILLFANPR